MDRFTKEFAEMRRGGADTRRADPQSRTAAMVAVITKVPTFMVFLAGIAFLALPSLTLALLFDLRPGTVGDLRLAAIVRSALPDADSRAAADLVARLSISARASRLLEAVLAAPATNMASWGAELIGRPPLAVDPGRVAVLEDLATRLAARTPRERAEWFDNHVEIERLSRDPDARQLLTIVGRIPRDDLHAMVENLLFGRALEELAKLAKNKLANLLTIGLDAVPDDPERAYLMYALPTLDPLTVQLFQRWLNADTAQRKALQFVLAEIDNKDVAFGRLLSAYYLRVPQLLTVVRALPPLCSFAEPRLCQ